MDGETRYWHVIRNERVHMTTTNVSAAQELRAALKRAGFNARQVTVRYPHSTLYVTIRNTSVSLTKVTAIASGFESVSRDHKTGEILCGGNTYVQVRYDDALIKPVQVQILAVLGPAPDDTYVDLPGGFRAIKVSRQHGAATYVGEVRIAGPTFDGGTIAVGVEYAAKRIAVAYLDASAVGTGGGSAAAACTPRDALAALSAHSDARP